MKTLTRKTSTLLSTALLAFFLGGVQPTLADDNNHEHKLSQSSENDPLFEKLPKGHSGDKHEIGNSENGVQDEKLPIGNNKDGHHDVEKNKNNIRTQ